MSGVASVPNVFASAAKVQTTQWDANWASLVNYANDPTNRVSFSADSGGANAYVLAPSPPVAYAGNFIIWFIAGATNTTAATAAANGLAALNIYKDSPLGPVVLAGGEIVAACWCGLAFDGTLNANTGGWHLLNPQSTASQAVIFPQGRLTLSTGVPVQIADQAGVGSIFYAPYQGSFAPVWSGSAWEYFSFSQITLTLDATGHVSGKNYDIFAYNNAGALAIGTGPAWSSDTARGTGAGTTQISQQQGVWTNTVAIVLRNNSVNSASIAVNQATYLGSFRATANGQTTQQFKPAPAAGGSAPVLGLSNAYNRVPLICLNRDSNNATTISSATPRPLDNSTSMRISMLDGLAQSFVRSSARVQISTNAGAASGYSVGVSLNSVVNSPLDFLSQTQPNIGGDSLILTSREGFAPSLGFNFYQGMEAAANTNAVTIITPNMQIETEM